MNKLYFSIIFLFILNISFSQNYLSIKPDAISYYLGISDETVSPIRIDSIKTDGINTEYYSFCMIRPIPNSNYYTLKGPSWIGKKMVDCGNGMNLFFNKENDTIYIKTAALLNESWRMYTFSNGNYVQATISTKAFETIIGLSDSVKTISLQVKNSSGTNISSLLNSITLKLSKNYGFLRITNFYEFPFDNISSDGFYPTSSELEIIGLSNPQNGWQNITYADIYNMQAGDEIQYDFVHSNGPYPGAYSQSRQTIKKYLNRQENTTHDTIVFTIEICSRTTTHNYYPYDTVIGYYHDTISSIFVPSNDNFNKLPLEPFFDGFQWGYFNKVDNMGYQPEHVVMYYNDSLVPTYLFNSWTTTYYYFNLGNETFHFDNYENSDEDIQEFHYYKINGIEWGTPYNCSSLLSIDNEINYLENLIIYPIPASNYVIIENSTPFTFSTIEIYDIQGRSLCSLNAPDYYQTIDISGIPAGIYFIKMKSKQSCFVRKLIITK